MLENFKRLIISAIACLLIFGSGFADERCEDTIFKNQQITLHTPLLTKQQIVDSYDTGLSTGATHMLIVWDTWNLEDSYNFVIYCYSGEDVNESIKRYDAPGFYRVSAVLAMHLDLNQQLSDKRWYPEYP